MRFSEGLLARHRPSGCRGPAGRDAEVAARAGAQSSGLCSLDAGPGARAGPESPAPAPALLPGEPSLSE